MFQVSQLRGAAALFVTTKMLEAASAKLSTHI